MLTSCVDERQKKLGRIAVLYAASKALEAAQAPGVALAVFLEGQPFVEVGLGVVQAGDTSPLPGEASFYLYSITKTMLATAMMVLVEKEVLSLDDAVKEFLPDLPLTSCITVRQLLDHTSGLPDYGVLAAYREAVRDNPREPWSDEEFLERTLPAGLLFEPGHGWAYSNIGYLLVKRILTEVTGDDPADALGLLLFAPLALDRTYLAVDTQQVDNLTPGFTFMGGLHAVEVISPYHPGWVAHGVVASTASETARFYEALFGGRIVSSRSLSQMMKPVRVPGEHPIFKDPSYGLGLMIDPAHRFGAVAGHGGEGPGYSTSAFHFPDVHGHTVTAVALVNRDGLSLGERIVFPTVDALAAVLGA